MITHDVVDHMAGWHGALTLDSKDRQAQPVFDGGDEPLSNPNAFKMGLP